MCAVKLSTDGSGNSVTFAPPLGGSGNSVAFAIGLDDSGNSVAFASGLDDSGNSVTFAIRLEGSGGCHPIEANGSGNRVCALHMAIGGSGGWLSIEG